jgi:hypothetical protein
MKDTAFIGDTVVKILVATRHGIMSKYGSIIALLAGIWLKSSVLNCSLKSYM